MNKLLQKIETFKSQNNPKRLLQEKNTQSHSLNILSSKRSLNSILKSSRKSSVTSIRNSIKKERRISSINSLNKQKRNSINLTKRSSVNFGKEQEKFVKRNSMIVTQGNVNTQALETLSNAAIKVQNLLSDFLENADDDDKQKFNIAEELKQIKENKNNQNLNIFSIIGNNSGKSSDSDNKNNKNKNNNPKSSLINRGKAASSLLLYFNLRFLLILIYIFFFHV